MISGSLKGMSYLSWKAGLSRSGLQPPPWFLLIRNCLKRSMWPYKYHCLAAAFWSSDQDHKGYDLHNLRENHFYAFQCEWHSLELCDQWLCLYILWVSKNGAVFSGVYNVPIACINAEMGKVLFPFMLCYTWSAEPWNSTACVPFLLKTAASASGYSLSIHNTQLGAVGTKIREG